MDQFCCLLLEVRHAVGSARRQDIYQMMRHRIQFFFRRFCRSDIHLPVNQHTVAGNDFPAEPPGQLNTAIAFAGSRRPQDHH